MLVNNVLAAAICAAACSVISSGQSAPPPVILTVDVENVVQYIDDSADFNKPLPRQEK